MTRQVIIYLLTALIALQSATAMADAHQSHQSGAEHLTVEHDHNDEVMTDDKLKVDPMTANPFDCDNCCHCHCIAQVFLGNHHNSLAAVDLRSHSADYHSSYISLSVSPDNPPPIS